MIKVIENMEPWEVMKAASEGKRVVSRPNMRDGRVPEWAECLISTFNWEMYTYAIIDESQPSINWKGFDWRFFEPYGGVTILVDNMGFHVTAANHSFAKNKDAELADSPLYPWTGGECPVPANVEVEVVDRFGDRRITAASGAMWGYRREVYGSDIIAFRLTGKVL